jgi:hypothetical protein
MKKTDWVEYTEHGQRYRVRAEYGMQKLGDQEPYFSLTGEQQRYNGIRWREDSFGQMHDILVKHFPELAKVAKWHLAFQESGPMHYVANGLYWWDIYVGTQLADRYQLANAGTSSSELGLRIFKDHVVFGAVDGDTLPSISTSRQDVEAWMKARLPALMDAFRHDMAAAGVVVL